MSGTVKQKHTYSLHCSSFLGLPCRILNIELVKPEKGTTMETIGKPCKPDQPLRMNPYATGKPQHFQLPR